MRFLYTLLIIGSLGASAAAAYFFFGNRANLPLVNAVFAYKAEVDKVLPAAKAGSANAQKAVADLVRHADPAFRDPAKAMIWYRKAADQGHIGAQYALGDMHARGEGTGQNFHRASEWFQLAAGLGRHRGAQFALGDLYFHGRGVPHSYGQAVTWYRKAARQGHPIAQYILGIMYKEGWGVDRDPVEAYKWITLAGSDIDAVKSHDQAHNPVGERENLLKTMNQSQLSRGRKLVKDWKPQR